MLLDRYPILLGFQASLKNHNYYFDLRSKNYQKKGQTIPKDCSHRSKLIQLNWILQLTNIFIY